MDCRSETDTELVSLHEGKVRSSSSLKETSKPVNKNCLWKAEHYLALALTCSSHAHSFNIDSTVFTWSSFKYCLRCWWLTFGCFKKKNMFSWWFPTKDYLFRVLRLLYGYCIVLAGSSSCDNVTTRGSYRASYTEPSGSIRDRSCCRVNPRRWRKRPCVSADPRKHREIKFASKMLVRGSHSQDTVNRSL